MSAANLWRDGFSAAADILKGLCGWIFLAPICALIPKRKDWIAVIGREDGRFVDNTKYFFIDAATDKHRGLRVVHVTERQDVVDVVLGAGLEAMRFPSPAAIWFLIRCGTAVVDSTEWHLKGRCFLLSRTKLIQLWHGVGFKRIELDKWRNEASQRQLVASKWLLWPRLARKLVSGRIPKYYIVVTTSAFYRDEVFSKAFRSRHVLTTGYPRNSFSGAHPLNWFNVDPVIREYTTSWQENGRRLILVAPTFRDSRAPPMRLDLNSMNQLNRFCEEEGYEILFKFHPYERGLPPLLGAHLHLVDPYSDIYPILPSVSAMVTDYSSIYMDFILLDRPVFFLAHDLEEYIESDRTIQFDYFKMTPGPKVSSWEELIEELKKNAEEWALHRRNLRELGFGESSEEASSRLLDYLYPAKIK